MEKTFKVLLILFGVAGLGLLGYHLLSQWHTKTIDSTIKVEKEKHLDRIAKLESDITQLTEKLDVQKTTQPSKSEMVNVFGDEKPMEPIVDDKDDQKDCKKITDQVAAFFQYLDSKAYLIWPETKMKAEELFKQISKQLSSSPPTNVGEMDDMYTLMRNVTHLYRVMGKNRINMMKEILNSESAVMEPAMAVLFSGMIVCKEGPDQLDLNTLYQYSHFFLNTLGGRSYLMRRDTKQQMLVTYYSLQIIDMANDAKLNSYGLDIRSHLEQLYSDIKNQKELMYHQRYLTRLSELQKKYQ